MTTQVFPVIDLRATGENIRRLRTDRGLTVRDLQDYFGFEQPRAIYKWQNGQCLPTVDNLFALGRLLGVPLDQILIPVDQKSNKNIEQQTEVCCSSFISKNANILRSVPVLQMRQPIGLRYTNLS